MRYSLLAGGKRIRPVLTLATARSRGADPASVLPAAAALELVHTYSLIHDDLPAIDDDTLRRGRPTCHVAYGEDVAILAGDGLFAEAFNVLIARQASPPAAVLRAAGEIAAATGVQGMVGGQYMDVAGAAAADDDLRTLHALKTGRLIEAAVVCGAVLSGAEDVVPYRAFAAEVGLLFQIVDDILDETGDAGELGKSVGKDRAQQKVTLRLAIRHGRRRAPRRGGRGPRRRVPRGPARRHLGPHRPDRVHPPPPALTQSGRPSAGPGAILVRRCGIWTRSPTPPTSSSSPSAS